ncbi:MAG: spore germination protein [Clostridia bacterium]|nr:spore germination protein [Clostridia bacterium]
MGKLFGIVGALILGEAAVTANVVSPILVIIIAITAISEFTLPDYSFSFSTRIFRLIYIFLGYFFGLFGIACGAFTHLSMLFSYQSFGVPFFSYSSFKEYLIKPIWKNEKRNNAFNTKRPIKEPSISMKWRKNEK